MKNSKDMAEVMFEYADEPLLNSNRPVSSSLGVHGQNYDRPSPNSINATGKKTMFGKKNFKHGLAQTEESS